MQGQLRKLTAEAEEIMDSIQIQGFNNEELRYLGTKGLTRKRHKEPHLRAGEQGAGNKPEFARADEQDNIAEPEQAEEAAAI